MTASRVVPKGSRQREERQSDVQPHVSGQDASPGTAWSAAHDCPVAARRACLCDACNSLYVWSPDVNMSLFLTSARQTQRNATPRVITPASVGKQPPAACSWKLHQCVLHTLPAFGPPPTAAERPRPSPAANAPVLQCWRFPCMQLAAQGAGVFRQASCAPNTTHTEGAVGPLTCLASQASCASRRHERRLLCVMFGIAALQKAVGGRDRPCWEQQCEAEPSVRWLMTMCCI